MTGRLPRPQSLSPGLCVQPAAAMHASHCAKVTSYLPTANGCAKLTLRCGPSSGLRPRSLAGDPMMNSPAGTAIISGQSEQSRNTSLAPAVSAARLPFSWAADPEIWNRMSRRRAIGTRKVGSTISALHIASLLEEISIWPNVGLEARKFVVGCAMHPPKWLARATMASLDLISSNRGLTAEFFVAGLVDV